MIHKLSSATHHERVVPSTFQIVLVQTELLQAKEVSYRIGESSCRPRTGKSAFKIASVRAPLLAVIFSQAKGFNYARGM